MLTSASVHDSQVAIPLMTMTSARVAYLYDLMDAAYDAAAIHDQRRTLGKAIIVDSNFREDQKEKEEWGRKARLKHIRTEPDDASWISYLNHGRTVKPVENESAQILSVSGALKVK